MKLLLFTLVLGLAGKFQLSDLKEIIISLPVVFCFILLVRVAIVGAAAGASPLDEEKVCQPHSRPWLVRLHSNGMHGYSGALINEWWIVTSFIGGLS